MALLVATAATGGGWGCAPTGGAGAGGGLGAALGVSPRITFDVSGFGAVGDGQADDTIAVQHALEAARQAGGATVVLPRGTYRVRPLRLFSGANLQIAPGAVLLLTEDSSAYTTTDTDGRPLPRRAGLSAINARDITIGGGGVIDGQSPLFRDNPGPDGAPATSASAAEALPSIALFLGCANVRVEGVTLRNAPRAALVLQACEGITVRAVRLEAPDDGVETRGIIVESTRNVLIEQCEARIGQGDAVVLRSGAAPGRATEAITLRDSVFHRAASGLSVGPNVAGGVRGVRVSGSRFFDVDSAIRVRVRPDGGGAVVGLIASQLTMDGTGVPFEIAIDHADGAARPTGEPAANRPPPRIADVRIANLVARGAKRAGIIDGLERSPITRLDFRQIDIAAQYGITCNWASGVSFREAVVATDFGPGMIRSNTVDLRLDRWQETTPEPTTRPASVPATLPLSLPATP